MLSKDQSFKASGPQVCVQKAVSQGNGRKSAVFGSLVNIRLPYVLGRGHRGCRGLSLPPSVWTKVFPEQKKSFVDTFFLKNWQHSLVLWQMPVVNFKVEFRAQKIEARVVSGGVGGLVHDLRSPKWSRNKLLLALGCFVYELEALLVFSTNGVVKSPSCQLANVKKDLVLVFVQVQEEKVLSSSSRLRCLFEWIKVKLPCPKILIESAVLSFTRITGDNCQSRKIIVSYELLKYRNGSFYLDPWTAVLWML